MSSGIQGRSRSRRLSTATQRGKAAEGGTMRKQGHRGVPLARSRAGVCWHALAEKNKPKAGPVAALLENGMSKLAADLNDGKDVHKAVVHFWARFERGLESRNICLASTPDEEKLNQAMTKFAATVRRAAGYREASAALLTCKHAVAYFKEDLSEAGVSALVETPVTGAVFLSAEGLSLHAAADELQYEGDSWRSLNGTGCISEHRDGLLKRFKLVPCMDKQLEKSALQEIERFAKSSHEMQDANAYGRLLLDFEYALACISLQQRGLTKERAQSQLERTKKFVLQAVP